MRNAETVLGIIHNRSAVLEDTGEPGAPKGCAVQNGESNPCRRQGKPGDMLPGQPSYRMAKA
jgi:hypothetical protein